MASFSFRTRCKPRKRSGLRQLDDHRIVTQDSSLFGQSPERAGQTANLASLANYANRHDVSSLSSDEQLLPAITLPRVANGDSLTNTADSVRSSQVLTNASTPDARVQRSASASHLSPQVVLVSLGSSDASRASFVSRLSGSAVRSCSSSDDSRSQRRLLAKTAPYPSGTMSLHVLRVQENGEAGGDASANKESAKNEDTDSKVSAAV